MKLILLSVATFAFVTSCNTMIGVGRDTQILGETVEKTAEKAAPGTADATMGESVYEADLSGELPVY